ncbi:MAG TPA: DivIVA domain-containing protein [Jiangellales bacterium]|nr:DivIVA domain-containing protein [Jiangellales bacterium]
MSDIANPTFRTRLHGYDRDQVNRMIDRIVRTLSGQARRDAVLVSDLQYFYFDVRMGGYDRDQVHQYLAEAIVVLRRRAIAA